MQVYSDAFWAPKDGNRPEEYEDAFSLQDTDSNLSRYRCAVADGATETSYSRLWAQLLADGCCEGRLDTLRIAKEMPLIREEWLSQVRSRPLPWYAEEKLRSGAYSSILDIVFFDKHRSKEITRTWRARAIGDSCLVQIRANNEINRFPLKSSTDFNNRPILISSVLHGVERDAWHVANGRWQSEDLFILMTDALACWFYQAAENGEAPWHKIRDLSQEDFGEFIGELRRSKQLRNDDVTLLRVVVN